MELRQEERRIYLVELKLKPQQGAIGQIISHLSSCLQVSQAIAEEAKVEATFQTIQDCLADQQLIQLCNALVELSNFFAPQEFGR